MNATKNPAKRLRIVRAYLEVRVARKALVIAEANGEAMRYSWGAADVRFYDAEHALTDALMSRD